LQARPRKPQRNSRTATPVSGKGRTPRLQRCARRRTIEEQSLDAILRGACDCGLRAAYSLGAALRLLGPSRPPDRSSGLAYQSARPGTSLPLSQESRQARLFAASFPPTMRWANFTQRSARWQPTTTHDTSRSLSPGVFAGRDADRIYTVDGQWRMTTWIVPTQGGEAGVMAAERHQFDMDRSRQVLFSEKRAMAAWGS